MSLAIKYASSQRNVRKYETNRIRKIKAQLSHAFVSLRHCDTVEHVLNTDPRFEYVFNPYGNPIEEVSIPRPKEKHVTVC